MDVKVRQSPKLTINKNKGLDIVIKKQDDKYVCSYTGQDWVCSALNQLVKLLNDAIVINITGLDISEKRKFEPKYSSHGVEVKSTIDMRLESNLSTESLVSLKNIPNEYLDYIPEYFINGVQKETPEKVDNWDMVEYNEEGVIHIHYISWKKFRINITNITTGIAKIN